MPPPEQGPRPPHAGHHQAVKAAVADSLPRVLALVRRARRAAERQQPLDANSTQAEDAPREPRRSPAA